MGHPSGRAERIAEHTRRAFVPVWARGRDTAYHARADVTYTLGDAIRADMVRCTVCGCRTVADPAGWDAVCAPCIVSR